MNARFGIVASLTSLTLCGCSSGSPAGAATDGGTSGDVTAPGDAGGPADDDGSDGGASGSAGNDAASGADAASPDGASDGTTAGAGDAASDASGAALDAGVLAMMRKVADWQLAQGGAGSNDWIDGTLWTGIMATYKATGDAKYLSAVQAWGQANAWSLLGGTTTNADNQCAAQTYFEAYLLHPGAGAMNEVAGAKPSFDAMVTAGHAVWTWEDALFMSPPGLARLGAIENDPKYFTLLDSSWAQTYAELFSPSDGLMYRDPSTSHVFWARGNGWVVAGTARVLEYLPPTEAKRATYVTLLQTMAAALEPWQGADGLWRSDITHPAAYPNPETSGTGLMTFAIAWGVNSGVLDRATYLPVAKKAWQGLVANVDAAGKLGYVQGVGAAPGPATATSTAPYGVGAFLLAGSEVAKLMQ